MRIRTSEFAWYFLAFILLALLGLINLNLPFLADQSVLIAGAKAIERGGTLYVDFWDNKMPGLFWFYWLGGKISSFDEVGIHLFELAWMLGFAIALAYGVRRYLNFPWLSALAPISVIGMYYASAGPNQLTLPEIIVCFPLFLCAWFAMRAGQQAEHSARDFFVSGLLAGVSVTFKLIFAPLCVSFWLVSLCFIYFRDRPSVSSLIKDIFIPVTAGVTIILALVAFKFWLDGGLRELLWTAFQYPSAALEVSPFAGKQRLIVSSMYIASKYAVWAIPISITFYYWLKVEKDIFTTTLIGWLFVGLLVILVQRFSWWGYHFFLIFPPVGLLAVKGVDIATRYLCSENNESIKPRLASALLSLTLVFSLFTIVSEKAEIALVKLVFEGSTAEKYRSFVRKDYAVAATATKFLKGKDALPGDIIVFGDPLYYHLSNRDPAIPMLGWPWEYFLQSQWLALPEQIVAASPPYIFIANREKKIMKLRKGGVQETIYSRYVALQRAQEGHWFQLKREFLKK